RAAPTRQRHRLPHQAAAAIRQRHPAARPAHLPAAIRSRRRRRPKSTKCKKPPTTDRTARRPRRRTRATTSSTPAATRKEKRGSARSFRSDLASPANERASTFERGKRYTSLDTEVVLPLTSTIIISKLSSIPAQKGSAKTCR